MTPPITPIIPIAVVGPTAAGKSDLGLDIAERVGGEIVNIDAMQQYRGMDIGTAKLAPADRRGIPHHRLDVLDISETATVANYQRAATADIESMLERGVVPVIVGADAANGYAQVLEYLDGTASLEDARERTLIGTRRYVRRQRSWFRRDRRVRWVDGADPDVLSASLQQLGVQ